MEMLSESVEFKDGLDLAGFEVKHPTFGIGTIVSNVANRMEVKFQNNETKWLIEPEAKLMIVSKVDSVQQDFEEALSEQEESKSDTDKLKDRINELEWNALKEEEKQRKGKENRNGLFIVFAILAFFPFMFWIGAFGPCLDC
tara:strand:- start:30 stop:455 length:426 start_codon:yes stop_codon:yes gene_type:complete